VPSQESPISQSYVDLVLKGGLEFGEDFAEEFIKTTKQWDYPWINNRSNSSNPVNSTETAIIDKILKKVIPKEFKRRIEK